MRWSLVMLFVSVVAVDCLYGEELPCQASKPTSSKAAEKSTSCFCPLFPIAPNNWYGEYHPLNSACLSPEATYFDTEQTTTYCVHPGCIGGGCMRTKVNLRKLEPISPILKQPVDHDFLPVQCASEPQLKFPNEHAKDCTFTDPRFITFQLSNGRIVTAKLFAVIVDVQKRTGGVGNPQRGKHLAFLGFECKQPQPPVIPKLIGIKYYDEGHAIVDLNIHQGIVLLAE